MRNIYQLVSIAAAALTLAYGCEEVEEKALPAEAGAISGAAANICPDTAVTLSVQAISGAAAYVWYKDGEVIPNASDASYSASATGSYAVAGKNDDGEGKKSAAHAVNISSCPEENADELPAAAGAIAGGAQNECPAQTVTLSVDTIEGATSYLWLVAYAEDDVDSIRDQGTACTVDVSTLAEGQRVSFTVSGVNALGIGAASQPHVVTKQRCLAAKPVIVGNDEWLTETRGDTTVYTTVCPATTMASRAATATAEGVIRYNWYWQQVGVDAELTPWTTDGSANRNLGTKGYTYNFAVSAVTADGESEMSNVVQVIGTECATPYPPGGTGGSVALFPEAAGFYPTGPTYNVELSNCDVQNVTYQAETGVVLVSNSAQPSNSDHKVISYSFWVKTPDVDTFRLVLTTGTSASARKITVDGITYPSGTYKVTAESDEGSSNFGNNEVTVTIRTDCPAPPVPSLEAPTFSTNGTLVDGVFSNACPAATANIYLTVPSTPSGDLTNVKWRRLNPNSGDTVVVWEGANRTAIYDDEISVADNGRYFVTYTKIVGGKSYESPAAEITIALKICPPTFASKTSTIVDGNPAQVVLAAPATAVASHITGYEWFYNNRLALDTEVSAIGTTSPLAFNLLTEGTYKVRAISSYGNSDFSEEITVIAVQAPTAFTRAELIGTYNVSDWRRVNNGGSANNYTLTIAAGAHPDSVVITGLGGNRGTTSSPWYATLKAAVSFTTDGKTTGNYGTISIPVQAFAGAATGATTYYLKHGTNYANPPTCDNAAVEFTIKFVNGGPGVSQTGVNYGMVTQAAACGTINYYNGGRGSSVAGYVSDDVVTWTKQ